MSYSILYRVAFLKLSDNTYVPVGESGDNNVWECGNDRRARDWSNGWSFFHEKLSFTEQEIISIIDKETDDIVKQYEGVKENWRDQAYTKEEILKEFSRFSCITLYGKRSSTAKEFMGWFRKGIRNARTIEEFSALGVTVRIGCWERTEEGRSEYRRKAVKSEDELRATYTRLTASEHDAYVDYDHISDYAYSRICPKKVQERKPQDKAYVVHLTDWDGYVLTKTSRKFHLTSWKEHAHRYCSHPVAERVAATLKRNGYPCEIEEISLKSA